MAHAKKKKIKTERGTFFMNLKEQKSSGFFYLVELLWN